MTIQLGPATYTRGVKDRLAGAPVSGDITSPFGALEPFRTGPHQGVDIGAREGTDILAPADGTVRAAGYDGVRGRRDGAGNFVIVEIDDEDAEYHCYHLVAPASVAAGQRVTRGQVIGQVGSTGNSTGPHLHFALFARGYPSVPPQNATGTFSFTTLPVNVSGGGRYIDPVPYFVGQVRPEPPVVPPPVASNAPRGVQPLDEALLARIYQYVATRGIAGSGGVLIAERDDRWDVTVRKGR